MATILPRESGPTRGPQAVAISVAFVAIAFIIVGLRLVTRFVFVHSVGPEDWLVVAALCSSITLTALIAEEVKYGMGRHFATLSPEEYASSLKPFYVSILFYNLSLSLIKSSIVIQYLRIFVGKTIRRVCWTLLAIIVAQTIFAFFSGLFMCTPIAYFWDRTLNGFCINSGALWFTNASYNIVSDIAILITPMPVLKNLQVPRRQKIGLILIFAVGAFECATAILRLHALYVVSVATDITWDNVGAATWSSVEVNVGIICSCLPMLKPFIKRFAPRLLGSTRSGTRSHAAYAVRTGGSEAWTRSTNPGTKLASSDGSKGFQLQDAGYKSNIFGMRKGEISDSDEQDPEGQIKVVKVFEVQHHQQDDLRRSGSSEMSLFPEPNSR